MKRYVAFIILAVAVVYGSSLGADFINIDDPRHLTNNVLMQTLSEKTSYAELRNNYAVVLFESGKKNEAVMVLTRTLEIFPDNPKARRILDKVLTAH